VGICVGRWLGGTLGNYGNYATVDFKKNSNKDTQFVEPSHELFN